MLLVLAAGCGRQDDGVASENGTVAATQTDASRADACAGCPSACEAVAPAKPEPAGCADCPHAHGAKAPSCPKQPGTGS